jgi:hypothetical protein
LQPIKLLLNKAIEKLDVNQAKREVEKFIAKPESLVVWSREFFLDIAGRIRLI